MVSVFEGPGPHRMQPPATVDDPSASGEDVGAVVLDAAGHIVSMDAVAHRLLGDRATEIARLLEPFGRPRRSRRAHADAGNASGAFESFEVQLTSAPRRWLEIGRIGAVASPRHELIIVRDVAAARRSRAIHEMFERLILHEIRTPMTGILAASELLEARGASSSDGDDADLIADIIAEAERLRRFVDDLSVVAGLDEGAEVVPEPLLLQRVVPGIVEAERGYLSQPDISCHIDDDLPVVSAERSGLEHALRNMIDEPRQRGLAGTIHVDVAPAADGVEVQVRTEGDPDDGPASDVLDPFGFVPLGLGEGSGADMGLYASFRLIDAMGGRLDIRRSDDGRRELVLWLGIAEISTDG